MIFWIILLSFYTFYILHLFSYDLFIDTGSDPGKLCYSKSSMSFDVLLEHSIMHQKNMKVTTLWFFCLPFFLAELQVWHRHLLYFIFWKLFATWTPIICGSRSKSVVDPLMRPIYLALIENFEINSDLMTCMLLLRMCFYIKSFVMILFPFSFFFFHFSCK